MLVKSLKIIALAALVAFVFIDPAFATGNLTQSGDSGGLFKNATNKASDTFKNVRTVIFIVGGFGLVGLAFGAIFGRVNWKWFAALAVGLLILAAAGAIVDYATTKEGSGSASAAGGLGDTFK